MIMKANPNDVPSVPSQEDDLDDETGNTGGARVSEGISILAVTEAYIEDKSKRISGTAGNQFS